MKVLFLSESDPASSKSWSGTHHYMYKALKSQGLEVVWNGPLKSYGLLWARKVRSRIWMKVFGRQRLTNHSVLLSRIYRGQLEAALRVHKPDVIFAPAFSTGVYALNTDIPIVYLSDTSFAQIAEYYPKYKGMNVDEKREGDLLEQVSLKKSTAIVYSSRWASDFAQAHYGVSAQKISVLPLGANIEAAPARSIAERRTLSAPWKLLFLGVSWDRKGGDIAFDAAAQLNAEGIPTELIVCGCQAQKTAPFVKQQQFIQKSKPEDLARLDELLRSSHVLVLPTKADAFGVVFCEAAAYGMPSLTYATGGTTTAVEDGSNGFALPPTSTATDFANRLKDMLRSEEAYRALCLKARDRFERELNWTSWAQQLSRLFAHCVQQKIK